MVGDFDFSFPFSGPNVTLIFLLVGCLSALVGSFYVGLKSNRRIEKRWSLIFETDQNSEAVPHDIIAKPSMDKKKNLIRKSVKKIGFVLSATGAVLLFFWFIYDLPLVFGSAFVFCGMGFNQFLNAKLNKAKISHSVQFPEAIDLMVRGARVGVTPEENIRQASLELPSPLANSFKVISHQLDIGLPFDQVLQDTANKLDLKEFRYLAATLTIQRKTGARYVDVLENLSQLIRSHHEQAQRRDAATAEARLAAKIVGGLVVVSSGLLFLFNREQFDFLMTDPTGQNLAIYCTISLAVGFFVMHQMLGRFR